MRTRPALVLTALLLNACVFGGPPATATPTPAATATPSSPATPTPAATSTPVPIAACRLPVASGDAPVDGNPAHGSPGKGGFIDFPAATFTPDPSSLGMYDRAAGRWLPVFRAWVSPDGKRYAYSVNAPAAGPVAGNVHVADVVAKTEKVIGVPAPSNVLTWEAEGIYVVRVIPSSGAPPQGLVLVNPDTGSFKQIAADGIWSYVGGGKAFGADLDSSIARPALDTPNAANRVRQLDLASGAIRTYGSYPGVHVDVLGGSGGTPILAFTDAGTYRVVGTGGAGLFSGPIAGANPSAPIVVDGSVTWFGSQGNAIWRSDGGGAIRQVATTPLPAAYLAGACR